MEFAYPTIDILCTCKCINHCLIAIFDIGEGSVVQCIKEGVFNAKFVGEIEGEEVGTTCVVTRRAMRTKNWLGFFAVLLSDFGIDVSTNDEVRILWDFVENQA
jgi:hypothetical protein